MLAERLRSFEHQDVGIVLCNDAPWFRAGDVTAILGYKDSAQAIRKNVAPAYVKTLRQLSESASDAVSVNLSARQNITEASRGRPPLYISEPAVYELVWHSKKPEALRFRQWIVEEVLPEIRRTGGYRRNQQISLMCETDLHYKVVNFIRRFFVEAIMVPGLGELQDTSDKRIDAWNKGYIAGQPDLILLNRTRKWSGLAIELKTPVCERKPSPQQQAYLQNLQDSGFKTLVSNDYDHIVVTITEFREEARRCKPRQAQAQQV